MPPIFSTAPRSPVLVRKQCSSQNPYRLSCAGKEPASFQSFVMVSILNMVPRDANRGWFPLRRVVAPTELGRVEEHAENLNVVFSGDACDDDADDEEADSAYER